MDPKDAEYLSSLPPTFPAPITSQRRQFDRLRRAGYIRRRWYDDDYELTVRARDALQLYAQQQEQARQQQADQDRRAAQQRSLQAAKSSKAQRDKRRKNAVKAALEACGVILRKILLH